MGVWHKVGSVKTTIEIADALLLEAKQLARQQGLTLRSLIEEGLDRTLKERAKTPPRAVCPVVFGGKGLQAEFRDASWRTIRNAAYEGHGA